MKRLLSVIVILLVLLGISVVASVAGVKKIKPNELKLQISSHTYFQNVFYVSSASVNDSAEFYSEVKLPKGKIVKKLTYYHLGTTSGPVSTWVSLYRNKFGEQPQMMAACFQDSIVGTVVKVEDETIEHAKIQRGYSYSVVVNSGNSASLILGIAITYK